MTPTQAFVSAIVVAVISIAGGPALTWFLGRRTRHVAEKVQEHDQWMTDADRAYQRVQKECDQCTERLNYVLKAFYGLLEDLEDQILPMLLLPEVDHRETRIAVRAAVRRARDVAASAPPA